MKTCAELFNGEILLEQTAKGLFQVTYGFSRTKPLDYATAAKELGECIMHHLTAESIIVTKE